MVALRNLATLDHYLATSMADDEALGGRQRLLAMQDICGRGWGMAQRRRGTCRGDTRRHTSGWLGREKRARCEARNDE